MLNQVLYTAYIIKLLEDETFLNGNALDEIAKGDQIRSQAQNFTIGNGSRTITPTYSHSMEDPMAISYDNSLNHGIGEALHSEL